MTVVPSSPERKDLPKLSQASDVFIILCPTTAQQCRKDEPTGVFTGSTAPHEKIGYVHNIKKYFSYSRAKIFGLILNWFVEEDVFSKTTDYMDSIPVSSNGR